MSKYNKYFEIFKTKDCVLLTTEKEFEELKKEFINIRKINVMCKFKCGHITTVNMFSFIYSKLQYCGVLCEVYENYKNLFSDNKCELLTTYEEYVKLRKNVYDIRNIHVKYKAICGHENTKALLSFERTNVYNCNFCYSKEKSLFNKDSENSSRTLKLEHDAFVYFKNILSNDFEIIKNEEGTLSDFCVKPMNIKEDKWLQIQLKTRTKPSSTEYSFGLTDKYKNCLCVCYCFQDNKIWLLDGNEVTNKTGIGMGLLKSKYDSYKVKHENLVEKIKEYYEKIYKFCLEDTNIPISKSCKVERKFRNIREKSLRDLVEFVYPEMSNLVYDFKIDNYKIQEKVGCKNGNSIKFNMHKHGSMGKLVPYEKGDNDFYWFHFPCETKCVIMKESDLENVICKKTSLYHSINSEKNVYYYNKPQEIVELFRPIFCD